MGPMSDGVNVPRASRSGELRSAIEGDSSWSPRDGFGLAERGSVIDCCVVWTVGQLLRGSRVQDLQTSGRSPESAAVVHASIARIARNLVLPSPCKPYCSVRAACVGLILRASAEILSVSGESK